MHDAVKAVLDFLLYVKSKFIAFAVGHVTIFVLNAKLNKYCVMIMLIHSLFTIRHITFTVHIQTRAQQTTVFLVRV